MKCRSLVAVLMDSNHRLMFPSNYKIEVVHSYS